MRKMKGTPVPEILLICGYGFKNLGDEAMSLSVIHRLRKAVPGATVSVSRNTEMDTDEIPECSRNDLVLQMGSRIDPPISKWGRRLRRALGVFGLLISPVLLRLRIIRLLAQGWLYARTGLRFTFSPVVREVLGAGRAFDLLYIAGGGNWNDIWLSGGLLTRMITVRLFRYFKKPVVISGQGVGPLESRYGRRFLKKSLRHVDTLTLRDFEQSENFLKHIGVRGPRVLSVGDDSYGLEPAPREEAERLIRTTGLDPAGAIMGVQVRLTSYHKREVLEHTQTIADIADRMVEKFGVKVLFIPTAFFSATSWDDRDHAYRVLRHMQYWEKAAVIHHRYESSACKTVMGYCRMVLATGYHPCVFALEAGVPTVGLYEGSYYSSKLSGLFRFYDLDDCAIEYAQATPERVEEVFRRLLADRQGFADRTAKVTAQLRQNIDVPIRRVSQLLQKPGPANAQGRGRRPQV
jgi:polysaccharide pyruvyl transferase WcaK-like protein